MNFDTKQDTKQNIGQLLLSMGAFGIVLVPMAQGLSASQQVPLGLTMASYDPGINLAQANPAPDPFIRYDSAQFSVNYPRGWQVAPEGDTRVVIVSTADGDTMPIRTDIDMLREDPATAVPQRLEQIVADAVSVGRYSLVTIDGQSGFRIWYEPDTEERGLVTFVGYGNQQTVILSSRYAPNSEAEAIVTQIHESFVNHSVAQATVPEP